MQKDIQDTNTYFNKLIVSTGAKYFEKYWNKLQLLLLINYHNYTTITGPVEMHW